MMTMSNETQTQEANGNEEVHEEAGNPTMINVRTDGLKVDLVLLENRVTGLTVDFQGSSGSEELHRWLRLIDGMLMGSSPAAQKSIPHLLGEAVTERRASERSGSGT